MYVFEPAARAQLTIQGPGALVVDTTVQPDPTAGHPIFYASKDFVDQTADDDTKRMVCAYEPTNEFVLVMLKPHERVSTYRIQFPSEQEPPSPGTPPTPSSRNP